MDCIEKFDQEVEKKTGQKIWSYGGHSFFQALRPFQFRHQNRIYQR